MNSNSSFNWNFRFNFKDPFPDIKWDWFENRVSGNTTWGNNKKWGDLGNRQGKNSVIYNSIQGDDLPTLGGGGGKITFWKHKQNYRSVGLHLLKEGVGAEGEISNVIDIYNAINFTIEVREIEFINMQIVNDIHGNQIYRADSSAVRFIEYSGDNLERNKFRDSISRNNRKLRAFYNEWNSKSVE